MQWLRHDFTLDGDDDTVGRSGAMHPSRTLPPTRNMSQLKPRARGDGYIPQSIMLIDNARLNRVTKQHQ